MRFGLIMPVCTRHAMQEEAWTAARQCSRPETPFYVLFNGRTEPVALPEGVQTIHRPERFSDECDLWDYCLRMAIEKQWDWCMVIHDDFKMVEPGWEADLEQSEGWKVAIAGWFMYEEWDEEANSHWPALGHLATCIDSFTFGFHVPTFAQRGCVSKARFGFGYGAWEANAWALENGYGLWRILLDSWHQWIVNENTRTKLGLGAMGHPQCKEWFAGKVLPAKVIDPYTISVVNKLIRIAPEGAEIVGCRVETLQANNTYVTGE